MPNRVAIISIGDELRFGLTVDTNAAFICRELTTRGWDVIGVQTVGDVCADIAAAFAAAAASAEIVIATGGLGPTADDRTREALSLALSEPLVEREDLLQQIAARFRLINRPMRPSNRVQAMIPRSAEGIPNSCGTAPGIRCRLAGAAVYVLPGVPHEMREMFSCHVLPSLPPLVPGVCLRQIHLFGIGESQVGEAIREWMKEKSNPLVGTAVCDGIVTVRALARGRETSEANVLCAEFEHHLRALFPQHIFGVDDETLAGAVVRLLAQQGRTLAIAESCTGGLLAGLVVDVPGASCILREGIVAYANESKERLLGVPSTILAAHGAVSRQTAAAMARGIRARSCADYALAITGIAGPAGGTPDKPVGTVWLALAAADGIFCSCQCFAADRRGNRARACLAALDMLRRKAAALPFAWETTCEEEQ